MTIKLIRVFFLFLSVICGYYLGALLTNFSQGGPIAGAGAGVISGLLLIFLEIKLKHVSLRNLSAAAFGLVFGFFMAWMVTLILKLIPMNEVFYSALQIAFTLVFCYLGMVISIKGKDEFNLVIPYVRFSREDRREQLFLLDTSVIIDGRVAAICETGFLEGKLVIPRFVLQELQQIADSPDSMRRNRGRRGLDMLDRIKKIRGMEVIIHDEGLPDIKEVDAKLVRLAKILDCHVLTNDFNLNKVAKLEGIRVLNINDLSNALRPVVFPGEQMNVYIKKEGKERNQGVAFMDDGTMIVVDNARRLIGKNVDISVTSVLQTSAGKMIFAGLMEGADQKRQSNSHRRQEPRPRNK
ncbi:MAG: PIN domain nuclease [Candidatus Makaraimicrobium thalassicum]|nr:MAG: PIN domain nuclease [Candidatus Omnitrophota bacterium]